MNIENYTSYFHDGDLIKIKHVYDKIELSMVSAEVHPEDLKENIPLSKDNRITGILYLEGIVCVKKNNEIFYEKLKMLSDNGDIFRLKILDKKVLLKIIWENYSLPPLNREVGFSVLEIEAEKIYWENIPNLTDAVS